MFSTNRGDAYLPSTLPSKTGTLFWSVVRKNSGNQIIIKVKGTFAVETGTSTNFQRLIFSDIQHCFDCCSHDFLLAIQHGFNECDRSGFDRLSDSQQHTLKPKPLRARHQYYFRREDIQLQCARRQRQRHNTYCILSNEVSRQVNGDADSCAKDIYVCHETFLQMKFLLQCVEYPVKVSMNGIKIFFSVVVSHISPRDIKLHAND